MPQRKFWRIRTMAGQFLILRKADLLPNERPLSPVGGWKVVERALANPREASDLSNLAGAVPTGDVRASQQLNRGALQRAILDATLVVIPFNPGPSRSEINTLPESVADQLNLARQAKTWVEMELVDMAGQPVANMRYICMLPDGEIKEGMLDNKGRVRFDGIDPGNCAFVLPDLDQEAWERAG
ncbi:MAG TPA: hypothetical protein VFQ91_02775 [Bryobacteraceae bacterium]|nr:hypothetical protein [Bryobacteraceae bacterium]